MVWCFCHLRGSLSLLIGDLSLLIGGFDSRVGLPLVCGFCHFLLFLNFVCMSMLFFHFFKTIHCGRTYGGC